MGCVTSKGESDVIMQCKERRKLIKNAVILRNEFAIAHDAYIQTLKNVGIALRRFSEGDVSDTSPSSASTPSSPVLTLPEASTSSSISVAPLSPPRAPIQGAAPAPSSDSPPSQSPPATPKTQPSAVPPASAPAQPPPPPPPDVAHSIPKTLSSPPSSPPLPVSTSPRISSHASSPPPPPLEDASSPSQDVMDMPALYSSSGMASPDRVSDFSPQFYSPRRDDADGYYSSYSPPFSAARTPPPMPSPSRNSSSWFIYDIFDAPSIPYNLLEHRRRRNDGLMDDEYEEEEQVEPVVERVKNVDQESQEEGMPELEDEETKEDDEEVLSHKDVNKVVPEEETPKTVVAEEENVMVSEEKVPAEPEISIEHSPKNASTEVEEAPSATTDVTIPSPEKPKEVIVEVAPKESPRKELAVVTCMHDRDLTGAIRHIHTHFAKAYRSGHDVSTLLETRMVVHSGGTLDTKESSKVFNAITTHWSEQTSLAMKDAYEDNDMSECGLNGSHALTLDRIYAWEKKLYDEVKAGEHIRMAFDYKCKQLQKLDAKGGDPSSIDKTKAALTKLDRQLDVALRSIELASERIKKMTNNELYPQLAELAGGLRSMWKVMWECHQAQQAVVAEMQTLENSIAGREASEAHVKATTELKEELQKWQTHFCLWIKSQKNYIDTLFQWLQKCHLEPDHDERGKSICSQWDDEPEVFVFLYNWLKALEKLEKQQNVVNAINQFAGAVRSLEIEQMGEIDIKKSSEKHARDLDYKTRTLRKMEKKYLEYHEDSSSSKKSNYQSTKADVDSYRSQVESEQHKHHEIMQDRKLKTLSTFKEHLPVIFDSMASYATDALKAYESVQNSRARPRENGEAHTYDHH